MLFTKFHFRTDDVSENSALPYRIRGMRFLTIAFGSSASSLDELLDNSSTLEDLLLVHWLGSTEFAKLGFCDGTELGFHDRIALGTTLRVSEIYSLRYADGSQHLSFGYPYSARKQLS